MRRLECHTNLRQVGGVDIDSYCVGGTELARGIEPCPAIVVGLLDLGTRLRLIANEVDVVEPEQDTLLASEGSAQSGTSRTSSSGAGNRSSMTPFW